MLTHVAYQTEVGYNETYFSRGKVTPQGLYASNALVANNESALLIVWIIVQLRVLHSFTGLLNSCPYSSSESY